MRKFLVFVAATFISGYLFAGGIVTNTNQSAAWVRLPAREASTDIDAAYYNPAGLMKLKNGFHFSISNQSIVQNKTVENFYKSPGNKFGLNQPEYDGKVTAPLFPSIYAVYKTDRLAYSLGFGPVGGGGGAVFKKGLPSFEMSAADLVPALQPTQGADAYKLDAYFEGTSIFLGFQGGVSLKVNDIISVAVGLRYVSAKNTYKGHLNDIEIELPTGWTRADDIMTGIAAGATTALGSTRLLVNAGAGSLTLAQAQGLGIITALQRAQLEGALAAFGSPTTVSIANAKSVFLGDSIGYTRNAKLLHNQSADVTQTGSGVAPIFSVNISPSENINIAIKYEGITKMTLKNKTKQDFTTGYNTAGDPITMFPDGDLTPNDMPALLTVGVDYKVSSALKLSLGGNYFFDKNADYGHKIDLDNNPATPPTFVSNSYIIDHNGYSIDGGLEYKINDKFLVSCGYIYANQGVNDNYQSDIDYFQGSQTFGLGGAYNVKDNIQINLGFSYTYYMKTQNYVSHVFAGTPAEVYRPLQTYAKNAMLVGIGVDFSF
jgi:long-chain fatty acid transport protein